MNAKEWIEMVNNHPEWNRCELEEPAISEITELVERDTAKEPVKFVLCENTICIEYAYRCPNCKKVYMSVLNTFCGDCGQKFKR